jgi:small nuclear ribonucleoprotein (snRNP)-like protein
MQKIENKVVVHLRDGRIIKGYTYDFNPSRETFHLADIQNLNQATELSTSLMKAVFFVKTFEGDKNHPNPEDFSMESLKDTSGLKVKVTFFDGELLYGTTHGYSPQRAGFFVFPADKTINNDRVFVIRESTVAVETWR